MFSPLNCLYSRRLKLVQGSLYRNFGVNKYDVLVAKDYLMSTQYTVGIDIDLINTLLLPHFPDFQGK